MTWPTSTLRIIRGMLRSPRLEAPHGLSGQEVGAVVVVPFDGATIGSRQVDRGLKLSIVGVGEVDIHGIRQAITGAKGKHQAVVSGMPGLRRSLSIGVSSYAKPTRATHSSVT